jgi:hypothetical protein
MKAHHRLVLLDASGAGVLDWRPGRLHWLGKFPADAAGVAEFGRTLARHPGLPVLVVLDSVDEDYRLEVLPHVTGAARDEMLARKLRQVFRNAPLAGACRQGREPDGRRDDRYLFAAVSEGEWLAPWLAAIDAAGAPLMGITLMAMACQALIDRLRVPDAHSLLACRLDGNLRLSYFHHGQLRFSRLITGDATNQSAAFAADEIFKTQLYLTGQRILPREARLTVLLYDAGSGTLPAAQTALNADPAFNARALDVARVARALRVPEEFLVNVPALAPLAALAGAPVLLDLAPPALTQAYVDHRWRRAIGLAALGIFAGGLALTAGQWLAAQTRLDEARRLDAERQHVAARQQALDRNNPALPLDAAELVATIERVRRIEARPTAPVGALAALGRVLERYPDVELDTLAWHDPGPTAPATAWRVELQAGIANFDGNYHAAARRIERLLHELGALPAVSDVALTKRPVEADSRTLLAGTTLAGAAPPAARFAIGFAYREAAQ